MGRPTFQLVYLLALVYLGSGPQLSYARTITVVNNCEFTVWPGTLSNANLPSLERGGFELAPGAMKEVTAPVGWAGRFWGRAGCKFNALNEGTCESGDCAKGLFCDGAGGIPPATLAEFTLDGFGSQDFYDVSLVDGYNLPLSIVQTGGTGTCGSPGCTSDLNQNCPTQLQVVVNGSVASCKSACEAFQTDNYCCSGAFNSPAVCLPTEYSKTFKEACPTAYSYAYDDVSSTFTCTNGAYAITFCPSGTSTRGGIISSPAPSASTVPPPVPGADAPPPPSIFAIPPTTALSPSSLAYPPPPPLTGSFTPPDTTSQFNTPPSASSAAIAEISLWNFYLITALAIICTGAVTA
ncbi:protein MpPR5a [Marchantia polymorpha subsp. ruderalis]|uniref:Thaumatin-like protein n=2 Tax=Marchantia polymorpha TaxID=3197 RepID=A0AAF6AQC9_MARPO|nr:hypothetical protein MARPO_0033s0148 [Marchantia polymorpha]BBM98649.1 hypothetical protein Mp_1g15130 [Marchantia polymorpha subsp. ruderalis]|eukprot:PTQ41760.1 hypothetical protein MARPO_0033s0148 [Marchantia polymorpha]